MNRFLLWGFAPLLACVVGVARADEPAKPDDAAKALAAARTNGLDWLSKNQNADGSWAGNHCITGRTFCTATALLVLMGDRAPRPDAVVEPTVSAPVV